jgi:hypothetical protein
MLHQKKKLLHASSLKLFLLIQSKHPAEGFRKTNLMTSSFVSLHEANLRVSFDKKFISLVRSNVARVGKEKKKNLRLMSKNRLPCASSKLLQINRKFYQHFAINFLLVEFALGDERKALHSWWAAAWCF